MDKHTFLRQKQDKLHNIYEQALEPDGTSMFTKADAFQHLSTEQHCQDMVRAFEQELDQVRAEVLRLQEDMHGLFDGHDRADGPGLFEP
jgi:phage shock protein A